MKTLTIKKEKLYELLAYGFYPSGIGLNNVKINKKQKIKEWTKQYDETNLPLDLGYIEQNLIKTLKKYKNKECTLLFSGGIDSTYLAFLLKDLNIKFNLLHIAYDKYNEIDNAKYIAKETLNMPIEIIKYTKRDMLNDLPKIVKQLNSPYERGSVLLTYPLLHSKFCKSIVIAGDSADYLFMPSFEKEHSAIKKKTISSTALNQKILDKVKYNNAEYRYSNEPYKQILLFDALHEIPYYYASKYETLKKKNQTIVLPYQNKELVLYGLQCKDLHKYNNKFYLHKLLEKYMSYPFKKLAFKINRFDIPIKATPKLNNQILKYLDIDLSKLTEKEQIKINFLLYLLHYWTDIHKYNLIEIQ